MIYGSTGVTHFDQLAEILTGYEMTLFGARSGGIFMGILFIAVGFLSKITAVPFRAAVERPPMGGRLSYCSQSTKPTASSEREESATHHYLVRA